MSGTIESSYARQLEKLRQEEAERLAAMKERIDRKKEKKQRKSKAFVDGEEAHFDPETGKYISVWRIALDTEVGEDGIRGGTVDRVR